MRDELFEILDILESLVEEDCSLKIKNELENCILTFKKVLESQDIDTEELIKVQDNLEAISNMGNVDSYIRNEIFNVLTVIESLV